MVFNRIIAAVTVAAALAVAAHALQADRPRVVPAARPVAVTATALPLNRDDPAQDAIDKLAFLGAVQLRATEPMFGGISALRAGKNTEDGVQLLGLTDSGNWVAFETIERGGRLVGVSPVMMVPIRQADGAAARTKTEGDAEALEWNPATGDATIVYERDHRLAHFTGIDAGNPASLAAMPTRIERQTPMTGWPINGGGEAVVTLPDGTRIVISEHSVRPDRSHIALLTRGGRTRKIAITGVANHRPTDAVALDATRILVLHRRFDIAGQGAALSLVDLAPAFDETVTTPLSAQVLARWQAPVTLDNMEGLALRRDGERVFVYIVSDDNFSSIQRTLLMKFELKL
jgi:hypothetical protein